MVAVVLVTALPPPKVRIFACQLAARPVDDAFTEVLLLGKMYQRVV